MVTKWSYDPFRFTWFHIRSSICDFTHLHSKQWNRTLQKPSSSTSPFGRYIDDLFSINNVDFGNCISVIYPSELRLTDTSTSSTEVCYLDTNIKTGGTNTPFRISLYDKRDDFTFRIVNFPHMDSNIPTNPAYGVYISQLVRYARICTSKVDFKNRLRGLSLRLRQQGFLWTELKNANGYISALRHRTWAQAHAHSKRLGYYGKKNRLCLKWKNKVGIEKIRVWSSF